MSEPDFRRLARIWYSDYDDYTKSMQQVYDDMARKALAQGVTIPPDLSCKHPGEEEWNALNDEVERLNAELAEAQEHIETLRNLRHGDEAARRFGQSHIEHLERELVEARANERALANSLDSIAAACREHSAWVEPECFTYDDVDTFIHRVLAQHPDLTIATGPTDTATEPPAQTSMIREIRQDGTLGPDERAGTATEPLFTGTVIDGDRGFADIEIATGDPRSSLHRWVDVYPHGFRPAAPPVTAETVTAALKAADYWVTDDNGMDVANLTDHLNRLLAEQGGSGA